jgi:hypothetical protein
LAVRHRVKTRGSKLVLVPWLSRFFGATPQSRASAARCGVSSTPITTSKLRQPVATLPLVAGTITPFLFALASRPRESLSASHS